MKLDFPDHIIVHPRIRAILKDRTLTEANKDLLIVSECILLDPIWASAAFFGLTQVWDDGVGMPCQAEVIRAVLYPVGTKIGNVTYSYTLITIPAANATGKSHAITRSLIPGWMFSRVGGQVLISASGFTQLRNNIFANLRGALAESPVPFIRKSAQHVTIGTCTWKPCPKEKPEWIAFGISPEDVSSFHGYHPQVPLLFIWDEAQCDPCTEIAAHAWGSILIGNPQNKGVLSGNPVRTSGEFAESIRNPGKKGFYRVQLDSYKNPNVVQGKVVIRGMATLEDIEKGKARYGEDSAEFRARFRGELPTVDTESLVGIEEVIALEVPDDAIPPWQECGPLMLVIDFAEQIDRSVFKVATESKNPGIVLHLEVHRGLRGNIPHTGIINRLLRAFTVDPTATTNADDSYLTSYEILSSRIKRIRIDAAGKGSPLCNDLKSQGYPIDDFVGSRSAVDGKQYENVRAEACFQLRDLIRNKQMQIPAKFIALFYEIANLKYRVNATTGRYIVLSKTKYIDEYGLTPENSPDVADTAAMWAWDETPSRAFTGSHISIVRMMRPPIIQPNPESRALFDCFFTGFEFEKRAGYLHRASFMSRRGQAATIWLHVDQEGFWAVYQSRRNRDIPVTAYWNEVQRQSKGQAFETDIFSTDGNPAVRGETAGHVSSLLESLSSDQSAPSFLPFEHLSSDVRGLDRIDRMLMASFADEDSGNKFWKDHSLDPANYRTGEKIAIYPADVIQELQEAKFTQPGWLDERLLDQTLLVAGPYVQCLRLLALAVPIKES